RNRHCGDLPAGQLSRRDRKVRSRPRKERPRPSKSLKSSEQSAVGSRQKLPTAYRLLQSGTDNAVRLPEVDRPVKAFPVGQRFLLGRPPVAHRKGMGDDAGARLELTREYRPQLQV